MSDLPDKTLTELREDDEFDVDEELTDEEEIDREMEEYKEAVIILGATHALAQMFREDVLTLREYDRIAGWLREKSREMETQVL